MNKTDEKIKKGIGQGLSDERIAAKLGRPLDSELFARITRIRFNL